MKSEERLPASLRRMVAAILFGLTAVPAWNAASGETRKDAPPIDLKAMRGRFRPVLVFSPETGREPEGAAVREQKSLFQSHEAELKERDVVIVFIAPRNETAPASAPELRELRRQFGVGDDEFTVVLVGKDGGEKFRSHAPVTIEKLKALIDVMPMRRQEVRDGHAK